MRLSKEFMAAEVAAGVVVAGSVGEVGGMPLAVK